MATDPRNAGVDELLLGAVGDVRDLLTGHGQAIRNDIRDSVGELKQLLITIAVAGVCALTGAVIVALAVAATIVRVGVAPWIALWIVAAIVGAIALVSLGRARHQVKHADVVPDESLEAATEDVKWVAERAADVVTETSADPGVPHASPTDPDRRQDRADAR
jgi:hypothetical protein